MHEEGERRRDLRERVFARFADLVELRPHARQDWSRPSDMGAEFVDVGFACPFDLGRARQLVRARTGQRVEVALDANPQASAARLDLTARGWMALSQVLSEEPKRATLWVAVPAAMMSASAKTRARETPLMDDTPLPSPLAQEPRFP
jgi:hypothetical protein